jgi:hypothetical protein
MGFEGRAGGACTTGGTKSAASERFREPSSGVGANEKLADSSETIRMSGNFARSISARCRFSLAVRSRSISQAAWCKFRLGASSRDCLPTAFDWETSAAGRGCAPGGTWPLSLAEILARNSSERARLAAATVSRLAAQSSANEVVRTRTGSCAATGRSGSMADPAEECVGRGFLTADSPKISAKVLPVSSGGGGNTEVCRADCQFWNRRQPTQPRRAAKAPRNSVIHTSLGINKTTTKAPSSRAPIPPPFPLRRPIISPRCPLVGSLPFHHSTPPPDYVVDRRSSGEAAVGDKLCLLWNSHKAASS